MRTKVWTSIVLMLLLLCGCKDDSTSAGRSVLEEDQQVRVAAETFGDIISRTDSLENFYITQTPDSFLIGECNTNSWATIKADLIAQFACPVGASLPDSSVVDSVALVMTYSSWFGEGNSPLRMSVYELDKKTLCYDSVYTSQEDINAYWSGNDSTHIVETDKMIVAAIPSDTVYSDERNCYVPFVRFMMNDRFVRKMNTLHTFPSQAEFNEFFKGLYITTTYGASTALYVDNLTMIVYYHYYYESSPGEYTSNNDVKYLYANSEVRQINRFTFPYKNVMVPRLQNDSDSLNYIVSPGYVYTTLRLPLSQYIHQIKDSVVRGNRSYHAYINKAAMRMDVVSTDKSSSSSTQWAQPAANMLLIRRDKLQEFFVGNNVPSSDYCLFSALQQTVDSVYNYQYYYNFDLSTILQNELRQASGDSVLEMVMVPVQVEYSTTSTSSTVVSSVKVDQTITFTRLRSAQDVLNPMNVDLVFSGFSVAGIR